MATNLIHYKNGWYHDTLNNDCIVHSEWVESYKSYRANL